MSTAAVATLMRTIGQPVGQTKDKHEQRAKKLAEEQKKSGQSQPNKAVGH